MKVFYLITKSELGGAQSVVYELLRGHKEKGEMAKVMAHGHGWLAKETEALGFEYEENKYMQKTYNPITLLRSAIVFRKSVNRWGPDVVSLHSSFSGIVGRLALLGSYPTVYTSHGWGFAYGGKTGKFKFFNLLGERLAGIFTKKVICVSHRDKDTALRYGIVPERKIALIYNGVEILSPEVRKLSERIDIVFVGRMALPKRQDILLDGFALLSHELKEKARVILIGTGPEEYMVQRKIRDLNIEKYVECLGSIPRENAIRTVSQGSISVLLSDSEGFPMTVLEAMSAGLPVIASRVGGIPEAVDETNGILVSNKAGDVRDALEKLIKDQSLRHNLGESGRTKVQEKFSIQKFIEDTDRVYKEILRSSK